MIQFVNVYLSCGCAVRRFRFWKWLCPHIGDTLYCHTHQAAAQVTEVTEPYSD